MNYLKISELILAVYDIKPSTQFKKDMKRLQKSGREKNDLREIKRVINELAIPIVLPKKNKDHPLTGNFHNYRECHIFPDLLLVYNQDKNKQKLFIYRIGSHSELFR